MKFTLYTTTKAAWYRKEAQEVAEDISNVLQLEIELITVKPPKNPIIIKDKDGDKRFAWDWFTQTFPLEGDGVGFHFTNYYKKKWGIKGLNGQKHTQNKEYPEFWMCADKGEKADGYEISEFKRLLYHELGHFFEELDDAFGNKLTQESVHTVDYELKQIHLYHRLVDFRGFVFKRKVFNLMRSVIQLADKIL
jgi:hypothetical protein